MTELIAAKLIKNSEQANHSAGESSVEETMVEKRFKQHEQWMRVMMEGQSTPDSRYQKTS